MSAIFLPRRWRHQPQGAVDLTDLGQRYGFVLHAPSQDTRFAQISRARGASPAGVGYQFTGSGYNTVAGNNILGGATEASLIFVTRRSGENTLYSNSSSHSSASMLVFADDSAFYGATPNCLAIANNNNGCRIQTGANSFPRDRDCVIVIDYKGGSHYRVWIDGVESADRVNGTLPSSLSLGSATHYIGGGTNLGDFTGLLHFIGVSNRGINDQALERELSLNPWPQLFRARPHRIWFDVGAGAGGATYNESFTESASVDDGFGNAASFASDLTESTTAGDSLTGGLFLSETIAEGVTAGDGTSATITFNAALSEAVTLGDGQSSVAAFVATIDEPTTVGDSLGHQQTVPESFSEGVTTGDSYADVYSPAGSFNESRTESTLVDDAYAHAQTHVAAFLEQVAPGDDYAVTGGTEIVTKRRGAGGSPRGYVARIGGRLVYADTLQALQAAIAQFEASIPARAEKKAQKAGKVVVRRLPKVEVVEAPAEDQGATRAAAQAANERIAAEYIAALQAQIAIRAAMEAAERDDMEAITVLELL